MVKLLFLRAHKFAFQIVPQGHCNYSIFIIHQRKRIHYSLKIGLLHKCNSPLVYYL